MREIVTLFAAMAVKSADETETDVVPICNALIAMSLFSIIMHDGKDGLNG